MPDNDQNQQASFGDTFVGLSGIIVMTIYLLTVSLFIFYVLVKIWPPDPLSNPGPNVSITTNVTNNVPAPNAPANTGQQQPTTTEQPVKWLVTFFWCDGASNNCWISLSTSLFMISMLSGALGSLLHSLRSFYWYAGNRKLKWSWALMYMLLPLSGSVLATIFYVVIRAGFLPSSGNGNIPNTPFGFAAMGALVGLFSEEAVLKLKQVAETVFTRTTPGKDHAGPAPKVSTIIPNSGPAAGGTAVTIAGTDFSAGAKVNFGGLPAASISSITATGISATVPAHVAGQVDVEVINADGQKGVLTGAYTYI